MIPDLAFVKDSFRRFNALMFSGRLPQPEFALTRARTFRGKMTWRTVRSWGSVRNTGFEMRVSVLFDLEKEDWEDVVIHEMIHLHIVANRLRDDSAHGPLFRSIMAEINRTHGRHIAVSSRSTDKERSADSRPRAHFICLARMRDGRLCLAPVAKSRIFSLWDAFSSFPDVAAVRWIGAIHPWFSRFPRVMTPKLYIAAEEDVAAHLKGALPLERRGDTIKAVSSRCSPDELLP